MGMINRGHFTDLRGMVRLAVDGVVGITDLVEKMHHTIQLVPAPLGTSHAGTTGGLTGFVYRNIRGTTRLVGRGLDAGMAPFSALLPEETSNATRDAFVSVINGIYGDHLVSTGNPLAIGMSFRQQARPFVLEPAKAASSATESSSVTGKVLLFIHGLCLNDGHWVRDGHNRGESLANDLGYTPLYLRYNTGLSIAENGRILAGMLESLLGEWPQPVNELSIIGHSMGGLVARSACHHGRNAGHGWLKPLRKIFFIGTPHHGAPLERGGDRLEYLMDLSPYASPFTRIGRARSVGITDLRHGSITTQAQDFVPLPSGIECYAMAASLGKRPNRVADRLIGDGLVPLDSALGRHRDPARTFNIPKDRQWVGFETGHIELLGSSECFAQLRDWLE